jgi:arylsulfatase A-like enzyme
MYRWFILALACPVGWAAELAQPPAQVQPNVLFIAVDDLRDWVGYYGRNLQTITPNLDRLASQGMAFTRAYCAAPSCNPSRAALMSGLRPSTSGVYNNDDDWRPGIPPSLTLVSAFRRAGYETLGAGKIYHDSYARRAEWEHYAPKGPADPLPKGQDRDGLGKLAPAPLDCGDDDLRDGRTANYAVQQLGQKHARPFFLSIGFHKPHLPWAVPRKYFELHPLADIQLPPFLADDLADVPPEGIAMAHQNNDHANILRTGRWREAVRGYLAAISYVDAMIGRVLDAYEKSPDRANTIIVLWSDHGWNLGEKEHWRKFALWEETTRSPLIWLVPGVTAPGSVCRQPVDLMSLFPTLMTLCGLPKPNHVEGTDIAPLLHDASTPWTQPALITWEYGNHAVRTAEWRYIRYARGGEELYNETADPNEWHNLAGEARYAELKKQLAASLPTQNNPEVPHQRGSDREDRDH